MESEDNLQIMPTGRLGEGLTLEKVEQSAKKVACSACGAPLAEIWMTRPDEIVDWRLRFACPHCGDQSYVVEVKGGIHMGATDYTGHGPMYTKDDYVFVEGEKLKEWV